MIGDVTVEVDLGDMGEIKWNADDVTLLVSENDVVTLTLVSDDGTTASLRLMDRHAAVMLVHEVLNALTDDEKPDAPEHEPEW